MLFRSLDRWGKRIEAWRDGDAAPLPATVVAEPLRRRRRDVFVYFDNDVKVRAPYDAMNLAARFGQNPKVAFPTRALRAVERVRGVEEPRTTWNVWTGARR